MIAPGDCVLDIGANAGYYTLLASRSVGPMGRVFAFEPLPLNLQFLREHIRLNGLVNVTVVRKAVSDRQGTARFAAGQSPLMGRLSSQGEMEIETVTIDGLVEGGVVPGPQALKIDVEGAEESVLAGAGPPWNGFDRRSCWPATVPRSKSAACGCWNRPVITSRSIRPRGMTETTSRSPGRYRRRGPVFRLEWKDTLPNPPVNEPARTSAPVHPAGAAGETEARTAVRRNTSVTQPGICHAIAENGQNRRH